MSTEYRLIQTVKTHNGITHSISIGQAFNDSQLERLREIAKEYPAADGELKLLKKTTEEIAI